MILRRSTYSALICLVLTTVVCLPLSVSAGPPQFQTHLYYESTVFSPFPGFDPVFISSITPTEYIPLIKLQRQSPYDLNYDYPDSSITYTRKIDRDISMVPVNSNIDQFVDRRIALSLANLSSDVGKESLIKDQNKKAGGLLQFTIPIPSRAFESIFGEGGAGLRVSGYRKISFSGRSSWDDQQSTALHKQSKFPVLQMEQIYRFDIEGTIGSKISVKVSQDSRNDLPLANRLILRYQGGEDDILQSVEAGNTTLNLPSTQFLAYSTRVQGLFGLKATAQLADLSITAIASQEKGTTETIEFNAGTSTTATRVYRDVDYKQRTIYDLGRLNIYRAKSDSLDPPDKYDFQPGDSILKAVVYLDDWTSDQAERTTRPTGICYVDPTDTLSDDPLSTYRTEGYFMTVDVNDYYLSPTEFYILFYRSVVGSDDVLAIYMEVKRKNGSVDTIGNIAQTPLKLKLIKPQYYTNINHHVWEYEHKNVYWLGATNIDLKELNLKIYKGALVNNTQGNPDDLDNQEGISYIQILGLDQGDDNGVGKPDNQLDRVARVDPALGYLYFPTRHPFDSRFAFTVDPATGDSVYLKDSVPEIYNSTSANRQLASQYYFAVSTQERGASVINLNSANIIEGSEVVKSGTRRLNRGTDYEIDYDFGRLTLLNDTLDINSDLSIMFEKAPFFSLERKTLLKSRFEYAPNRDFKLGTTLLYKSDKSTSRKPKVGEETSKMFVWDADLNYRFENPLFTTLVNALPFVSATSKSYMQVSGELAQSFPNPNVDGEVYVDDFEGSKDSYQLGILRNNWRKASRPMVIDTAISERGHIAWYNPYGQVPVTDIWPGRGIGTGEANLTNVLNILFKPVNHKYIKKIDENVIDSVSEESRIDPENSWAGFMRNIPAGASAQLETTQLLEIRIKGDSGIMHIDLGQVTEDINGNSKLDTEDPYKIGILYDSLDYGLDGLPDAMEFGYDPENGVTDPAGDNWSGDIDNFNPWKINGTENNRNDPDGGYYPDTEDPNQNGLEQVNSYFSYKIDLSDTLDFYRGFYVEGTRVDSTGWRTIRIPLRDPQAIDTTIENPTWTNIKFVRVWFDSASAENIINPIGVQIASMELLATTWADSFVVADSLRSGPATFDVAVVNNEVDADYTSPPGVQGYYDQTRDVVESEQSLLLTFENLNAAIDVYAPDSGIVLAADTGLAVRKFYRAMNFMGYGKLQAYVHGGLKEDPAFSDSVMFFFRMGYDKSSYYEYRTIIKPGWDGGNDVLIDFGEITGLKARLLDDRQKGLDSSLVRQDPGTKYLVRVKSAGTDPTLTRMQYFSMGVVNLDPNKPASGDIWVDELRLTNVRNDVGMAARVAVNGNMSDLITYSVGFSTQDAYYRGVSSATKGGASDNLGSGQTKKNYNFSGSFKLDKFFPRALELQMPLSINWSQSVQEPLLRSGTDIIVPADLKKQETAVSVSKGFRISEKFNRKTRNPLFTVLLNRFSSSFSYNISRGHSATQPMYMSERHETKTNFDLSLKKPPSITPFKWTALFRAPFGLPGTRLYLYPTGINFSGDLSGSYSESINQNSSNPTTSRLDFRGGLSTNFKVIESLSGSYSFNTTRDLRDPKTVNLTFNPKKFKLGVEQSYNQGFRANYSPNLFRFLTHKFDYSASYGDTYRLNRDSTFYHSVVSKVDANASFTLKHQSLIGSNRRSPGRGGNVAPADSSGASVFDGLGLFLRGIRYITDAIKPISGKFGTGRSLSFPGLADKASIPFRLGLTDDPGVGTVNTTTTTVRASKSVSRTFSANSGVALFAGISVDVGYGRNTRETFDASPTRSFSETWPDLNFNLRSVKGLWYIGKLINTLSPSSHFTRSKDSKRRTSNPYPSDLHEKKAFAPLLSFTVNPMRSMRSSARYETSTELTTRLSESSGELLNITRRSAQNLSLSWTYSFRNPSGIKLPIFGRIKFESNLSVTMDVSYRKSRAEVAKAESDFDFKINENKTSLTIQPSANYSFSSTVKGGLSGRWQDSNDAYTRRKSHSREIGIWVELRF